MAIQEQETRRFRPFGEVLKESRKAKDLTQVQLAAALGKSLRTIQMWEGGHAHPDHDSYHEVIAFFGPAPFLASISCYRLARSDLLLSIPRREVLSPNRARSALPTVAVG
jgi:transcriptional regulator with XRE-family HTH domain